MKTNMKIEMEKAYEELKKLEFIFADRNTPIETQIIRLKMVIKEQLMFLS